jgi:hypothetical protein
MRLYFLMVAVLLAGAPVMAQQPQPSSSTANPSSAVDDEQASGDSEPSTLPVSLDRIREALAKAPPKPLLRGIDKPPDFSIGVEERITLEKFFKPEDFQVGPVPPGGLYGHELQSVLSNKVDRPLEQPYAAFSSGELITLAIESLVFRYLGQRIAQGLAGNDREAEEAAARATVLRAIQEYCAAQPGAGANIQICSSPPAPR